MRLLLAATVLFAVLLTAYLPDLGHGFLKDDFRWIQEGRSESVAQVVDLFTTNVGFYRPLVSLSFAADYRLWALQPFGYGLTNLALLIACAALLFTLARRLGLPAAAALLACGVFALNVHAVNMALLWLSGRTSLLALVFALLSANALLRGQAMAAGVMCLAAMLSKEEALALPAVLTIFWWLCLRADDSAGVRVQAAAAVASTAGAIGTAPGLSRAARPGPPWVWLWVALLVYAAMRSTSGAFTPATAPDYYRLSVSPSLLVRNVAEYADRAGTIAAAVSLLMLAIVQRTRPWFSADERRVLTFAGLWIPAMFVLTVLLPVRSSLYALVPSVGSALVAAACASRALRLDPVRFTRAALALIVAAAALVPIYWSRNERWVAPADLSRHVMDTVQATTSSFPAGGRIVLIDDPAAEVDLADAFNGLFAEALALYAGELWVGQVVEPGATLPVDERTTIAYELRGGTLEPVSIRRR